MIEESQSLVWHDYRVHFDTFGYIKEHLQNRMQHVFLARRRGAMYSERKTGFSYIFYLFLFSHFSRPLKPKDSRVNFTNSEIQVSAKCKFCLFHWATSFNRGIVINFSVSESLKNSYVTISCCIRILLLCRVIIFITFIT